MSYIEKNIEEHLTIEKLEIEFVGNGDPRVHITVARPDVVGTSTLQGPSIRAVDLHKLATVELANIMSAWAVKNFPLP